MLANSTFLVNYPLTVEVPSDGLIGPGFNEMPICNIYFDNVIYKMRCPVDNIERSIKMLDGLTVPVPEGSELTL